jgi:hypothetical protein
MLHLEVLVEDSSGKRMLERILPRIMPGNVTFKVFSYKGVGHIPKNLQAQGDPAHRILLAQLPRLLGGYGKAFKDDGPEYNRVVLVICDSDARNVADFYSELQGLLANCNPAPTTIFCLATEEGEAWLLSDGAAVLAAYPKADKVELAKYVPDSIVGTWERLADVVYPGGHKELSKHGFFEIGAAKHEWAEKITPHLDIANTRSPSFRFLLTELESLAQLA